MEVPTKLVIDLYDEKIKELEHTVIFLSAELVTCKKELEELKEKKDGVE